MYVVYNTDACMYVHWSFDARDLLQLEQWYSILLLVCGRILVAVTDYLSR